MLLQDMYDQYWPQAVGEIWDSANLSRASTGSLKLYGGRKFQDQMVSARNAFHKEIFPSF